MTSLFSFISSIWSYTTNHKWSKDILQANILSTFLVIVYDLFHFSLEVIDWRIFSRVSLLLSIRLFFKFFLDGTGRYLRARQLYEFLIEPSIFRVKVGTQLFVFDLKKV